MATSRQINAALNHLAKYLKREAAALGYSPDEISILPAGHTADYPLLTWESGPFEWAPALTGGSSLLAGEFNKWSQENKTYGKVREIQDRFDVFFECYNSFQIAAFSK